MSAETVQAGLSFLYSLDSIIWIGFVEMKMFKFQLRLHKEFVPNERETNLSNLIEKENETVQIPIGPIRGLALPRYFIM